MPPPAPVLSEDEALELLAYLITAARTQVDEAAEYGPLRLLTAARRLAARVPPRSPGPPAPLPPRPPGARARPGPRPPRPPSSPDRGSRRARPVRRPPGSQVSGERPAQLVQARDVLLPL